MLGAFYTIADTEGDHSAEGQEQKEAPHLVLTADTGERSCQKARETKEKMGFVLLRQMDDERLKAQKGKNMTVYI